MAERIVIDLAGRKGLAPKWGGDIANFGYEGYLQTGEPNLRYLGEDAQMANGVFDPLKKYGYLSPASNAFINVSQADFDAPINNDTQVSLVDPVQEIIYFFEQAGDIFYGNFDGTDFEQHSPSSTVNVTDAVIYYKNGVRTIYEAVIQSGGSAAGIREFAANAAPSTINTNWSSADATNAFNMYVSKAFRLIPSGDGFMYVLNKNAVHRVDGTVVGGTEGTIYRDILKGPEESFLTHGVEYNNYLYIVVQNNEQWDDEINTQSLDSQTTNSKQVGVYVWNRQSTFFNSSNFIELPGVSYVKNIWVSSRNQLFIMAIMPTGEIAIMKFDGSKFIEVEIMPWGSHITNKSAMQTYGMFTYWLGSDGFIYRYGSEYSSEKEALTIIGQLHSAGVEDSKSLCMVMVSVTSPLIYLPSSSVRQTIDVMYIMGEVATDTFIFKRFIPYAKNIVGFPQ